MSLSGLHFLLTYKCNARCGHCFLSAGPQHKSTIREDLAYKMIDEAARMPGINHLFVEGGEPFLFPDLMEKVIRRSTERGLWIGALTNGFWAVTAQKGHDTLKPLVDAGLQSLSVSTDAWHQEFVPARRAENAVAAAEELGLPVDVMVCAGSDVVGRGRAAGQDCFEARRPWRSLTECRERLSDPGRVHIGPAGEIHLCQGLLLGKSVAEASLATIFGDYDIGEHPIAQRLAHGGPAALAQMAVGLGWRPRDEYGDGCQLCYEARAWLRDKFPVYIGPAEIYPAA